MRPGWPGATVVPFPNTWLLMMGGVWDRRSRGDMLRRLFGAAPELGSVEFPLFLFWVPVTNSSASSIIIPCDHTEENISNLKTVLFGCFHG